METATTFSPERARRLTEIQEGHFWFEGRRQAVETLLGSRLARPQRILDVGCGAGGTLRRLVELGHEAVGVDMSLVALDHARVHAADAELHQAPVTALPFSAAAFDGVLLLDVLEHVGEEDALSEIRRVLKPGGWVALSVPAWPALWGVRDVDAGHLRRYTQRRLVGVVRQAGLVVERVTYYQCSLFPLLAASRLIGRDRRSVRDREDMPGALTNRVLASVNRTESRLIRFLDLPFGSSLLVRGARR